MAQSMFGSMYDARQEDEEENRKAAYDAAALGGYKTMAAVAGEAGGMLGQGIGRAFGGLPQAEAKQAKIQELMQLHPNPKSYEDFMAVANDLKNAGLMAEYEKAFEMADKMKPTTPTSSSLDLQKLKDSLTYLESTSGIELTPIEKKQWLARTKKTVSVGEWGSVDTGKTNFNSILTDRESNGNGNGFRFEDTQATGAADINKKAVLDKKVTNLSNDLIKATNAEHAISRIEDAMAKYKNADGSWKDIPGFSSWEKFTRSAEGDRLSALWENLIGELRNDRFGSVLTKGETELFEKIKTGNWLYLPDSAVIDFVESMRARVDAEKVKVRSGYDKNVTSEYDSRRQVFNDDLASKIKAAKKAGYSDAQIEAFISGGK